MAKDEKQYSIRLKNGKYIGLVNIFLVKISAYFAIFQKITLKK